MSTETLVSLNNLSIGPDSRFTERILSQGTTLWVRRITPDFNASPSLEMCIRNTKYDSSALMTTNASKAIA